MLRLGRVGMVAGGQVRVVVGRVAAVESVCAAGLAGPAELLPWGACGRRVWR